MYTFEIEKSYKDFEKNVKQVRDYWIDFAIDILKRFQK